MKGVTNWNFRPYTQMHMPERGERPYICRIAPFACGFELEFIDNGRESGEYALYLRERGEGEFSRILFCKAGCITVEGIKDHTDYEAYIMRDDGERSSVRLIRTGWVPGRVINYLHPDDEEYAFSGRYLCSPSIIRLDSGRLLSSMDVFEGGNAQNLTLLFYSNDDGETWRYLTELFPCFWGKMFLVKGALYMLAVSNEYGDILIGRSDDEGETWSMPSVLFRGGANTKEAGLHRAPMPVLIEGGRVMTDVQYGAWGKHIMTDAVLSASADSDLLRSENWSCTRFWRPAMEESAGMEGVIGGIEGSIVKKPDGSIADFLRYADGKWLLLNYSPDDEHGDLKFDRLIDFPATASKANVIFDEKSGCYVSLASYMLEEPRTKRNLLSLLYSKDLINWKLASHILDYRNENPQEIAFQYVDFFIEKEDILFQSRTAFNNAKNFHDSNYATFHRIKNFRSYLAE